MRFYCILEFKKEDSYNCLFNDSIVKYNAIQNNCHIDERCTNIVLYKHNYINFNINTNSLKCITFNDVNNCSIFINSSNKKLIKLIVYNSEKIIINLNNIIISIVYISNDINGNFDMLCQIDLANIQSLTLNYKIPLQIPHIKLINKEFKSLKSLKISIQNRSVSKLGIKFIINLICNNKFSILESIFIDIKHFNDCDQVIITKLIKILTKQNIKLYFKLKYMDDCLNILQKIYSLGQFNATIILDMTNIIEMNIVFLMFNISEIFHYSFKTKCEIYFKFPNLAEIKKYFLRMQKILRIKVKMYHFCRDFKQLNIDENNSQYSIYYKTGHQTFSNLSKIDQELFYEFESNRKYITSSEPYFKRWRYEYL